MHEARNPKANTESLDHGKIVLIYISVLAVSDFRGCTPLTKIDFLEDAAIAKE